MKRLLFSLLVFLPLISTAAFACPGGKGGHGDRMIKQLDLNAEQVVQFRGIMQAKRKKMHAFHEEQHNETLSQLNSVLTAEQMQEFQQLRERRMQRKKERCKNKQ